MFLTGLRINTALKYLKMELCCIFYLTSLISLFTLLRAASGGNVIHLIRDVSRRVQRAIRVSDQDRRRADFLDLYDCVSILKGVLV